MDITARIVIHDADGSSITEYDTTTTGNNISDITKLDTPYAGKNCFILGASKLGGGDTYTNYEDKYGGKIDDELTSSDGTANMSITINGTDIDQFSIFFDSVAQQWATELTVDGVVFPNDDVKYIWTGTSATTHTIVITKWNKPYYPVRITSITVGLEILFDRSNLYGNMIIAGNQSMANNKLPKYGVISQYGSISGIDRDGEIKDLAELGLLEPDLDVEIKADNILIGKYKTEKWSYPSDDIVVKLQLTDELVKWQSINIDSIILQTNKTALDLFNILNTISENVVIIDSGLSGFLTSIKIQNMYLERNTLWNNWNKLCDLAQLLIYKNQDGIIVAKRYQ